MKANVWGIIQREEKEEATLCTQKHDRLHGRFHVCDHFLVDLVEYSYSNHWSANVHKITEFGHVCVPFCFGFFFDEYDVL